MKRSLFIFSIMAFASCQKDAAFLSYERADTSTITRPIIITGSSSVAQYPDTSFTGYDVRKVGRGGYSFADMRGLTRKQPINFDSLLALNPKQWIIQGGDNDVSYKFPLWQIQSNFQWIVNKILSKVPDCQIVFLHAKPTAPNKLVIYSSGETGWQITEYFNRNATAWGMRTYPNNFTALNTYAPLILWGPKRLNTALYKADQVHLNARGYTAWNKLLLPVLIK
jgi:lysophospholipase L1-like esterase